jgi:hypothetical protein
MGVTTPSPTPASQRLAAIVSEYETHANVARLLEGIARITASTDITSLMTAAESFRQIPEVAGPIYEHIVRHESANARALVGLANAYWLTGRGPEVVGDLASRALAADPENRAAWHLWALTESNPRARVGRWQQITARFPNDQLARANLADNAASLAGAEDDPAALILAIDTFEELLTMAEHAEQRGAIEGALKTLRAWRV